MKVLIRDYPKNTWYQKLLNKIFRFYYLKQKPRPSIVEIDSQDLWNLDCTLALIIKPALEKFLENEVGSFQVDNKDLPGRMTIDWEAYWDSNNEFHKETFLRAEDAWKWILKEMIFAFDLTIRDNKGEIIKYDSPDHKRMENGLRLFGKYFRSLWN